MQLTRTRITAGSKCASPMTVVCGLLRGAMQVISKYLTVLCEETTSARQQQGGSRRLAALIATAGDGRDHFLFSFFFFAQYFSQYLVLTNQMTLTQPKQKLHSKSRETEKAQTFALWWKISGFDSQKKLDKLGREQLQFPPACSSSSALSPHCPNSGGPA